MKKWYKLLFLAAAVALPVLAWAGSTSGGCLIPGCPCQ
jgi:hypothetical protein